MKYILTLFIQILTLFGCSTTDESSTNGAGEYQLVWSDEFEYTGLPDTTKWAYDVGDGCPELCGWGNNELQYYTANRPENAFVNEGVLTIQVQNEKYEGRDFTSAKLVTKGKQDWKYGRFEIRAKLPTTKGVWSAIWMMPTDTTIYGRWPRSGVIDIMENVGFDPDTVEASAHTGAYYFTVGTQKHNRMAVPDCDENFHTYTLEWEED